MRRRCGCCRGRNSRQWRPLRDLTPASHRAPPASRSPKAAMRRDAATQPRRGGSPPLWHLDFAGTRGGLCAPDTEHIWPSTHTPEGLAIVFFQDRHMGFPYTRAPQQYWRCGAMRVSGRELDATDGCCGCRSNRIAAASPPHCPILSSLAAQKISQPWFLRSASGELCSALENCSNKFI